MLRAVIKRHGFAALSTALAIVAVVLLAADQEHPAVYVTLVAIAFALIGGVYTASHRRGT
jgi:hypothetical protein